MTFYPNQPSRQPLALPPTGSLKTAPAPVARSPVAPAAALPATGKQMPAECSEVIKAIVEGKYSWACVLMLRSCGYNPLHYIPYRTYQRLLKENAKRSASSQ